MPLIVHEAIGPGAVFGVWRTEEPAGFFEEELSLFPEEVVQLPPAGKPRHLQWLAARWLLHCLSADTWRQCCLKDDFGKPYWPGDARYFSLSHSHDCVAAIVSDRPAGIDIQLVTEKIRGLAPKFMRPDEMESLRPDTTIPHLHVYWGAKEALYKAYGRRGLDFRGHIAVAPFGYRPEGGDLLRGTVQKGDFLAGYALGYRLLDDYVLVYCLQQLPETSNLTI